MGAVQFKFKGWIRVLIAHNGYPGPEGRPVDGWTSLIKIKVKWFPRQPAVQLS